jgi:DNA-binding response OmpR family regulator
MIPRILIVDDEEDISTLVYILLTEAGYHVVQAFSGRAALELLKKEQIDLVILDVMLPDMTGWEVCRRIRNEPGTAKLPVVYFTVRNQLLDTDREEWQLADGYVPKPFEPQELIAIVKQFVGTPCQA